MERSELSEIDPFDEAIAEDGTDRVVPFLEYHREKLAENKGIKTHATGIPSLDGLMNGFKTGELNTISGPTGNGKTLFAETVGHRLMRVSKINVAWFSYEVATAQMIQKYVHADDSHSLPLYVPMELKAGNFDWLKRKCLEAQLKYNCQAVFIDHLHFLVDMGTKHNMSLNIGAVMRQLKHEVAKGMNLMVFLIAHQGQAKEDHEPSIDNIRDSSFIGQESDNVFVVYRNPDPLPDELKKNAEIKGYPRTYDLGYCTVKIEKARRSGTYRKKVTFQKQGDWLEEV